ncbi:MULTISPECIES: phage major capsid protein [Trueperella]|uniref:phage major capsid protein n=1 Tax=Trueperella TaxID=1069494 RepID=UPI0008C3380F|nr:MULTISPECIES: phage major capsid protein [Trueperella]MCM3907602.1 phage major capsid protein [Trueperella bernardiae]OFS72780.1 phage capsid protein [Trueperella sp. HMSC08B05]
MTIMDSKTLTAILPEQYLGKIVDKAKTTSTVARLSAAEPMLFGNANFINFNDTVRAEFVEEKGEKSSTSAAWEKVTAVPRKSVVTVRVTDEFMWTNEDHQAQIIDRDVVPAMNTALSRALDLGLYHRINPLTGNTVDSWANYLTATSLTVEQGKAEADADIRAAAGLVIAKNHQVTGLALDPKMAWALGDLQGKLANGDPDGRQRYPEIGLGANIDRFLGLPVAVGDTVSGQPEATDTKTRAIVGDFTNGIRWGIQKQIPLEVIPYGDPDGQGDLKRANQVALRLEIVYAWHVLTDRFAVVKAAG